MKIKNCCMYKLPVNISHKFYISGEILYFLKYKNIRFQYFDNFYKNFAIIDEIGDGIEAYYDACLFIPIDQHIKRFIHILKHSIIQENDEYFKHPNQWKNEYFIKITSEKSRIKVNSNNKILFIKKEDKEHFFKIADTILKLLD